MAPASTVMDVLQRRYIYNDCNYNGDCYSNWDNWGRWVALVVIVICLVIAAFLFSCFNSRRRRRQGRAPMYGTGWLPYHQSNTAPIPNNSTKPPGYGDHPPPPYMGGQATGTTFNSNAGYYGTGNSGAFELQQPSTSYQPQRGGNNVYDAPQGPPPSKGGWGRATDEAVIR